MTLHIVMPVLNEAPNSLAASLQARLQALQPLRARGAWLTVVDGGSTDGTWALARSQADALVLAPRGRAAQMNAGAFVKNNSERRPMDERYSPNLFLFLHADTRLPPDADRLIRAAIGGAAPAGDPPRSRPVWGRFDVRIDSPRRLLRMVEFMMNWRSRLTGMATGDQAIFVTAEAFDAVGGYAGLALMEDIDLSARLRRLSAPACLPECVITSARRWEKHGVWRTIALMWWLRAAFFLGVPADALARRYGYLPAPAPAPAALAILAKAPQAGFAKTRLIPLLGERGAARAQRQFTLDTLHTARAAALGEVTLWCAPDTGQRFFRALARRQGVTCIAQPSGPLGVRMAAAFARHFGTPDAMPLLLVGTDCPTLAPGHLQQAALALRHHDVVLIPAEDGGYVLIGMRRCLPQVFEGIDWSTDRVMAQTREKLRQCGASWQELDTLWDVDEPADWARLRALETGRWTPLDPTSQPVPGQPTPDQLALANKSDNASNPMA